MIAAVAVRLGTIAMHAQAARLPARDLGAHSLRALDRRLACPGELWVAVAADRATVLGAFQRAENGTVGGAGPAVRRGSGGPAVLVGPGTVHVALALASPGAIVPCDEKRIVNRAVRPLLKALTKAVGRPGVVAHYFGRDWVSVGHRPAAWVGFGHDAGTRRTLFEAFVAVSTPFSEGPRPSLLDKAPATLEELAGAPIAPERVAEAILQAYVTSWPVEAHPLPPPAAAAAAAEEPEPPWAATVDEAIGPIGAGPDRRGAFRVGGDLLVSRDALAALEAALDGTNDDEVGALVDARLARPGVALDGVRSLTSVRDAILSARRRSLPAPTPSRP